MISVLIPSYNNPQGLLKCVKSLWDRVDSSEEVEIIIRVDKNDPKIEQYRSINLNLGGACIYESESGSGYNRLHVFINELANNSRGRWILIMTDDSIMKTLDWDKKIKKYDSFRDLVINPCGDGLNLFPIISRELFITLGHLSLSPHYDTWISTVAHENGRQTRLHNIIEIEHLGPTNDHSETSKQFYSEEMQSLLKEDIEKLKVWISNEKA